MKCYLCGEKCSLTALSGAKATVINCCHACISADRAKGKETGKRKLTFSCAWKEKEE